MMKKLLFFGLFALSLFFISCSTEEEPTPNNSLESVILTTGVPDYILASSFRYVGIVDYAKPSMVFGHIISKQQDFNLTNALARVDYQNPNNHTRFFFFSTFHSIEDIGIYYIKAFATDGNRIIYGPTQTVEITGQDLVGTSTPGHGDTPGGVGG